MNLITLLLGVPLLAGITSLVLRPNAPRRLLLVAAASLHAVLVAASWLRFRSLPMGEWLGLDAASLLFLAVASAIFLAASVAAADTLSRDETASASRSDEPPGRADRAERIFTACMLFFLTSMTLVIVSRHLGLLWVAVEATTLASAPLIYHHRHKRSLEAAWKYLLICSVGIALALLGNFFLAVATSVGTGHQIHLAQSHLLAHAADLDPGWLKAGFLLLLVGYGTKMGLVPMHTWLPDAHSEAPSMVSALLSGALLNCAFLGILRVHTVLAAAGLGVFARQQLVLFGLLSMSVAALSLLTQVDYKRMLAYSSVEHMGVLVLGIGLGGAGTVGSLLHAVNHSLAKGALFLTAGAILASRGTKKIDAVRGLMETTPATAMLWVGGILAIVGSPPFGLFASELMILKAALSGHHWGIAAAYLGALSLAFMAMIYAAIRMAFGTPVDPAPGQGIDAGQPVGLLLPPALLLFGVLLTGLYIPGPLSDVLREAAMILGGQ